MPVKYIKTILLIFFSVTLFSQTTGTGLNLGDKAPPLVLTNADGASQGFTFPYQNKMVLIHFWSSSVARSKLFLPRVLELQQRYSSVQYRNTDGFEVVTVAIQSDKSAWHDDIKSGHISELMNTIVVKGYNDMYIKTFKISQLSLTLLVDETGTIISINPTQLQLEQILDEKKNSPINLKDFKGKLLYSETTTDFVKDQKLVLLNKFRDTLARTITDKTGNFSFTEIKLMGEYILQVDTGGNMLKRNKFCLATINGPVFAGETKIAGILEHHLYSVDINRLIGGPVNSVVKTPTVSFVANVNFKKGKADMEGSSHAELDKVVELLNKNKDYTLEIISHTDSQGNDAENMTLSTARSEAVKKYLVSKEIKDTRIKAIGKGETEIKNKCKNYVPCTEEEHAQNVRTELKFYK